MFLDVAVVLVHFALCLAHRLGCLNAVLLALLIPAPFIDLTFSQASLFRNFLQFLLAPTWLEVKLFVEEVELVGRLALSFSDDALLFASNWIYLPAATFPNAILIFGASKDFCIVFLIWLLKIDARLFIEGSSLYFLSDKLLLDLMWQRHV